MKYKHTENLYNISFLSLPISSMKITDLEFYNQNYIALLTIDDINESNILYKIIINNIF